MAASLRIAVVAGEASGDLLGSRVISALRARSKDLVVEGVGGPQMESQGLQSMFPMERLSVMGLVDPLKRLPELLRIRHSLHRYFRDNPPDIFLGIDSPDFNLPLERKLRRAGVPTAHLVSPSVWAWRQGRVRNIRKSVDLMLCLLPFETDIYRHNDVPVRFVGHPLADEISHSPDQAAARTSLGLAPQGKVLALLPGSRAAEIVALAPLFLQVADLLWRHNQQLTFVLPAANAERGNELRQLLQAFPQLPVTLVQGQSREAMTAADAVLLASGTATLEAALLKRPMVVAYRMGALSWFLLSKLVRTEYVALPNILAGKALVPELLQGDATTAALLSALAPLLAGPDRVQGGTLEAFAAMHRELQRDCAVETATALLDLVATRRRGNAESV
jgi:lipid-A-disaccharide synthase